MYKKFKRIFLIVIDSVGIGSESESYKYGDDGANTLVHISKKMPNGLIVPTLNSLGLYDLDSEIIGTKPELHPKSYVCKLKERSNGKDTMTGHWEMMGVYTTEPFLTFTDTGFPKELIDELEAKTGHKVIGNCAASGTEIIKELGEEQVRDNSLIVYTSADSVLQIAAHEEVTGLQELYRCCDIAREICMKPEWMVGRIIARPYIGTNKDNFKRTPNRHDISLEPSVPTVLNILSKNGLVVDAIGKIYDIFGGSGVTKTQKTVSNEDGMNKTIEEAKFYDFEGLCFVNLVEFDSEYGHRRDPLGYGKCLERFDVQLKELLSVVNDDDLVMVTADHGNDPTWTGTDHTREMVPLFIYNKTFENGGLLPIKNTFGDIGATILYNFDLEMGEKLIGAPIKELFN